MESIFIALMDSELALAFIFSTAVFIGLSFLIVMAVRSVPNKLLLLGLLVGTTAVVLAATLPGAQNLAFALLIPAIILILGGAICLAIGFVVKLVKSDNRSQSGT